jgi:D-amino peptidase
MDPVLAIRTGDCLLTPRTCTTLLFASVTIGAVGGAGQQPAARPDRLFISADMEGVAGVVQPAQLGPAGFEYARAREWMTGEVNAVIEGARAAGIGEFVIADSHGNAQNLLLDALPEDVEVVRGFPRPLSMMHGIDDAFAAAVFVGYHASEYGEGAVRSHTFSSAKLLVVRLNGAEVSEGVFNAAIAGHYGVPVILASGDRIAVEQIQAAIPGLEGVVVKEPFGYHSARTVTPRRAQAMLRDGVQRALQRSGSVHPYRLTTPIDLEVGFKLTIHAERASYVPGLRRLDAHTVGGRFEDILQVTRLIQVLTSLEE